MTCKGSSITAHSETQTPTSQTFKALQGSADQVSVQFPKQDTISSGEELTLSRLRGFTIRAFLHAEMDRFLLSDRGPLNDKSAS